MTLKSELDRFLASYDPYASKYFAKKIRVSSKYSPIISNFYRKLSDFTGGGKKLRAFLVWVGYRLGGGSTLDRLLPFALAFELAQSFFLIHDDIIDRSSLRRGKPTIHKIYGKKYGDHYGTSMAIILGDIANVEVFDLINNSNFDERKKVSSLGHLIKMFLETAYGETLDIEYTYDDASLSDVEKVTDLKTARYSFVGPLTIGAILSGASKKQLQAIEKYGLAVGVAFQMQDDILGVFGDEKTLGKSILSDMLEGKNTVLIHKTKEMAGAKNKRYLDKVWGSESGTLSDLKHVRRIIKESGALDWCIEENRKLVWKAKTVTRDITKDDDLRVVLGQVADFVANRDK